MDNNKATGCDKTVLALLLVRLGVGIFFLGFGLMKLFMMGPQAIVDMMSGLFGVEGQTATLLAWIVILTEAIGGLLLILGKLIPRILYQLSIVGFAVITVVGFVTANWLSNEAGFDPKQFLWHLMLLIVLAGLLVVGPKSPCGIIGDNDCEVKQK